ncbi:MAG: hypothetical protein KAQ67_12830 [Gammaproteobacteria bacterium]|nr:hypothetical protein [Gammaproteobacteria bacterium]
MKLNSKNLLIAGLIVLGLALILSYFLYMSASLSFIIAFLAAIAFYLLAGYYSSKKSSSNDSSSVETPKSETELGIESLLSINIQLRKCIMPVEVRDTFEQIIDQLLELLPKINQAGPDGELAWVINRMATEYLQEKSIKPYIALDEAARNDESTIAAVEEALSGMRSELAEVESMLAARKTGEFNSKAKFMKQRFNI